MHSGAPSTSTIELLCKLNRGTSYTNCEKWGHVIPSTYIHALHYACLGGYYHQIMQQDLEIVETIFSTKTG